MDGNTDKSERKMTFKSVLWNIFLVILGIAVIIVFVLGFLDTHNDPLLNSDIKYYEWFVEAFPSLYYNESRGFINVVYLPYFYWLFLPWYPLGNTLIFYYFSLFNLISIILILIFARMLSNEFTILTYFILLATGFHLGMWANVETMVTAGYVVTYAVFYKHKKKRNSIDKYSIIYGIIVSFLGFKLLPLLFMFLFMYELVDFDNWKKSLKALGLFLFGMIFIQGILNAYFLIINPDFRDINYFIEIFQQSQVSKWYHFLARPSVSIPLIFPAILLTKLSISTLKKRNKLEKDTLYIQIKKLLLLLIFCTPLAGFSLLMFPEYLFIPIGVLLSFNAVLIAIIFLKTKKL
ncbi:MAG: hypothetical protein GF364_08475 [Candidatus Lokiarchaeota archaeon]|nr:hypothetical protein [Candidatus Lokiarchaeota archaeon]